MQAYSALLLTFAFLADKKDSNLPFACGSFFYAAFDLELVPEPAKHQL